MNENPFNTLSIISNCGKVKSPLQTIHCGGLRRLKNRPNALFRRRAARIGSAIMQKYPDMI